LEFSTLSLVRADGACDTIVEADFFAAAQRIINVRRRRFTMPECWSSRPTSSTRRLALGPR
jgi:hypothetical protein